MSSLDATPIKNLSFGTIFKIIFWAGVLFWGVVSILVLISAFVSPSSISVSGKQAMSTAEALMAVPMLLILGSAVAAMGAAVCGGLLKLFGGLLPLGSARLSD